MIKKCTTKKLRNQAVILYTEKHLSSKMQKRMRECGNWIDFVSDSEVKKLKAHRSNFCKNRFCPMCSWRMAKKDALQIGLMMEYIEREHKKAFIFLTLTAPNVKGEMLVDEITKFNRAFNLLLKYDELKPAIKGYVRKLEITYNSERDDFHPHFHCIIAVNKSYFTDSTYVKQQKWLSLWRRAMNDESITQVNVKRVVRSKNKKIDKFDEHMRKFSAINEVAKYAAKDSDYAFSQEVFDCFYQSLKGRQVLTYGGLFKDARELYKAHKLDKYLDIDNTEYTLMLLYRWGKGEYVEKERRELTDEEYNQINKQLLGVNDYE